MAFARSRWVSPHGSQEFLQKHFPWMRWVRGGLGCDYSHSAATPLRRTSMVIDHFLLSATPCQSSGADTVLVINTNAMLSLPIPFQGLKPIFLGIWSSGRDRVKLIRIFAVAVFHNDCGQMRRAACVLLPLKISSVPSVLE